MSFTPEADKLISENVPFWQEVAERGKQTVERKC